jgi:hypothetical protein
LICALVGSSATAAADEVVAPDVVEPTPPVEPTQGLVVATDPVPDPQVQVQVQVEAPVPEPVADPYIIHEPYYDHPAPLPPEPEKYPHESVVVWASGLQAWLSEEQGMTSLGQGASLSFAFMERDGDFPTGFDVSAVFLSGERASVYDLSFRLIGSAKIQNRKLVPFAALGLAAGAARLVTDEQKMSGEDVAYGWAIGPSAAAGVHGFLSKKVYWRASAGFLGTGIGAMTADVGFGLTVD